MSVTQQVPWQASTGNGATTVYPYQWKALVAGDLAVYVDGVQKILSTDYSVSGLGIDSGGNVTFVVAPASGTAVRIVRAMRQERLTDYQNLGDFQTVVVNPDFDRGILLSQDLLADINRCVRAQPYEVDSVMQLPAAATRANGVLTFDALGNVASVPASSIATLAVAATAVADVFNGNGSTTVFALSQTAGSTYNIDLSLDGATLLPSTDYNVTGATLTLTNAPLSGQKLLARYNVGIPGGVSQAPYYAQSTAEISIGVVPVNTGYIWGDPRRYGADSAGIIESATFIQTAINVAQAGPGGTVAFPPGTFKVNTSLLISASHVKFIGSGSGNWADTGTAQAPSTKLLWTGASAPTTAMLSLATPVNAATGNRITGITVEDINFDCNGLCGEGVRLTSIIKSFFIDIYVSNPITHAFKLTTLTSAQLAGNTDTQHNTFDTCSWRCRDFAAAKLANGIYLTDGDPLVLGNGNPSFNIFNDCYGQNDGGGTAVATFTGTLSGTTLTVAGVTGVIALGQTVQVVGVPGQVLAGTRIISGAGPYTVNNSFTAGATFTGTIAATTLTTSAVVGTIQIGCAVTGAGVAAGTYITAGNANTWTVTPSQAVGPVAMAANFTTLPMGGYESGRCLLIENGDNNQFNGLICYRAFAYVAACEIRGINAATDANHFFRFSDTLATAAIAIAGISSGYATNPVQCMFFAADQGNTVPYPALDSGCRVYWNNSNGTQVYPVLNGAVLGMAATTASGLVATEATALAQVVNIVGTSRSVLIHNNSSAHVILTDGANIMGISLDGSGNIQFSPIAGGALSINANAKQFRSGPLTAVAAGGASTIGLTCTSTVNFGTFFGSGVPTLSVAKGSLYLRSDGAATNDRAYINTNGTTAYAGIKLAYATNAIGNSGTAFTMDCALSDCHTVTMNGNVAGGSLTISNIADGQRVTLILTQDGTGTRTLGNPTGVKWPAGVVGVLSVAPAAVDRIKFERISGVTYAAIDKAFA